MSGTLAGKTVALSGPTGGIGKELCRLLLREGAALILLDRSPERSAALQSALKTEFPGAVLTRIPLDLADIDTVRAACAQLRSLPLDILIHNAGAYAIPRYTTKNGFDNVYHINAYAPYIMTRTLLPHLRERGGRVVAVGSIAHRYSKTDPGDVDFHTRRRASLVYGNAKRRLMFALYELFRTETEADLCICHPGITLTNITAHYPKAVFTLIKPFMKVLFMPPRRAAQNVLRACTEDCAYHEWIGPQLFDIWGKPAKRVLHSAKAAECAAIFDEMENSIKEPLNTMG